MGDPLKLFEARDIEAAALYAKRTASNLADLYPVLVDNAGNLCVNMTVGTVSLSSTASTITNAVGNPVNVSITNTAGTVTNSVSTIQIISRTLTSTSGSLTATNGTITVNPTNKLKIYAFSLTTTSATEVTCVFHTGPMSGSLELWRCTLRASTSGNSGANLAVPAPAFLFSSRSGTAVSLSLSTAVLVHYSVSYFDEA